MRWAHSDGKHDAMHAATNEAKHETLARQKTGAQLVLDGQRAVIVQRAVSAGKAKPTDTIQSIARTKKAVDAATTEKQLRTAQVSG